MQIYRGNKEKRKKSTQVVERVFIAGGEMSVEDGNIMGYPSSVVAGERGGGGFESERTG